jgi:hypothetical protein
LATSNWSCAPTKLVSLSTAAKYSAAAMTKASTRVAAVVHSMPVRATGALQGYSYFRLPRVILGAHAAHGSKLTLDWTFSGAPP